MTSKEFQTAVIKYNWFDKYYYYLISFLLIIVSIFLFQDIITNRVKYDQRNSSAIAYTTFSLLFLLGCYSLYLIPNRYRVLTVGSNFSIEKKREILGKLSHELRASNFHNKNGLYTLKYQRHWWTPAYNLYISIDEEKFLISVLSKTYGYPSSGFIDLGGTQRLRKQIFFMIKSLLLFK